MKTIRTTATVGVDGKITIQAPSDIPIGEHRVLLVIHEQPITQEKPLPLKFSAYPIGLISSDFTFRREDLYGDR